MSTKKTRSILNKKFTFTVKQGLVFISVFAIIGVAAIYTSYAAPNGNGKPGGSGIGSGSISLSLPPVTDNNIDGQPNWGDVVRFNISTTATQPRVKMVCSQNNVVVAQGAEAYYSGTLDDGNFGLFSSTWTSGAADCVASLQQYSSKGRGSWIDLGVSTTFHVNP